MNKTYNRILDLVTSSNRTDEISQALANKVGDNAVGKARYKVASAEIRQDSKLNTNDPLKKQLRKKAGQANRVSALVAARVKTGQHVDPKDK
tara:strand:- start:10 stop:285 length:276 start_codon:yes stop_codon:yes gene_type:complete